MWQSGIEPRYPFGFGLSYTTYSYSDLQVMQTKNLEVTVQVKNTGTRAGLETVQVYASCQACQKRRLPIVLAAFTKVSLDAGEIKTVKLTVQLKDLTAYQAATGRKSCPLTHRVDMEDATGDGSRHSFLLEGGEYQIFVGSCAHANHLLSSSVTLEEQTFSYPGKARKENFAPVFDATTECSSFKCSPEGEDLLLKKWALPDKSPVDVLILISLARKYWPITIACGVAIVLSVLLLLYKCFRRCCKSQAVAPEKKQT
eukprot:symbB.v1.2.002062.t1/scaffold76.1/size347525/11